MHATARLSENSLRNVPHLRQILCQRSSCPIWWRLKQITKRQDRVHVLHGKWQSQFLRHGNNRHTYPARFQEHCLILKDGELCCLPTRSILTGGVLQATAEWRVLKIPTDITTLLLTPENDNATSQLKKREPNIEQFAVPKPDLGPKPMLGLVHVGSRAPRAGLKPANLCRTRWLGSKESYHVNAVFNSKYHRSAHEILCCHVFTYAVHGGTLEKETTEHVPTHVRRR